MVQDIINGRNTGIAAIGTVTYILASDSVKSIAENLSQEEQIFLALIGLYLVLWLSAQSSSNDD